MTHAYPKNQTPSMVSYRNGVVKACGVEAVQDFEEHEGNVAHWFKVIVYSTMSNLHFYIKKSDLWLKLHLHPAQMSNSPISQELEIPPLPTGITIEQVYADMMKYMMENTQRFFEMTTADGAEIWARVRDAMVIMLVTPRIWGIPEEATLRKAAISASLITEENADQLLQFAPESESSMHYALAQQPSNWLKMGVTFAVIDCGGSTVDTAVYRCVSTSGLDQTETRASECVQVCQPLHLLHVMSPC